MFQTMPSMPVLALVMPAVSGCITRELPGWSVALSCPYSEVRTSGSTLRCELRNQKDRARHSTTKDPSPKPDETALACRMVRARGTRLARASTPSALPTGRVSNLDYRQRLLDRGSPDWADDPLYSRQTLTGDGHEDIRPARRRHGHSGRDRGARAGKAQDRHHCHTLRAAGRARSAASQRLQSCG